MSAILILAACGAALAAAASRATAASRDAIPVPVRDRAKGARRDRG